jgi:hypothetical protein
MSTGIDQLINYGFLRTGDTKPGDTATVVVVGLPRSGTSMIAAVLKSLGVFIGDAVDNAVYEDRDIAAALAPGSSERLLKLIEARNAAHPVWGFKRPEAYRQLDLLAASCRNLRVIATFRDILAIALRNRIAMQIEPLKFLPRLAEDYLALVRAITRVSVPCLLVSYEKSLQFPVNAVDEIAKFCGLDPTREQIATAVSMIDNGNSSYVQAARLRYQGSVGRLVDGHLRGWVKVVSRDDIRVEVELRLNGQVVDKARADLHRPDVQQAGFGDGRYGFAFPIKAETSRDSIVEVKVQNSDVTIKNSGLPLSQY